MTTIILTPEMEQAVAKLARQQNTTPEAVILEALREKFHIPIEAPNGLSSLDDWDQQIRVAAEQVEAARTGDHDSQAAALGESH